MNTANRPIRFLLNDQPVELDSIDPTMSWLTFLRENQRLTGTKEGCAEGDCGACTVVVGESVNGTLQLQTMNACIQFVPVLDGKAIYTVEHLRGNDGTLHPAQQSMLECHGSQCGFCTPGFVMSLWACYLQGTYTQSRPDRKQLALAVSGNLCRCTGYRPILDAADAMFDKPTVSFDRTRVVEQLQQVDSRLPLTLQNDESLFFAPHNLSQLLTLRSRHPDATLLAGSTDIGLWVNKQLRELTRIISIGKVQELKTIQASATYLRIGAGVSLTQAYSTMAKHYPALRDLWERFAAVPVRNAGTLGGNVANGSPIGDSMPWLIVLQATVILTSIKGSRSIPLESLYIDYMKNSMQPDEIIEAIEIPLPTPDLVFRTYKVAKRHDSDISAVCAAFAVRLNNNCVVQARVAFGGMAAIPKRAKACEATLLNSDWDAATVQSAMQALRTDFDPLSDMRASQRYRTQVAENLLQRFFLETRSNDPLPATQTSVYAVSLSSL